MEKKTWETPKIEDIEVASTSGGSNPLIIEDPFFYSGPTTSLP